MLRFSAILAGLTIFLHASAGTAAPLEVEVERFAATKAVAEKLKPSTDPLSAKEEQALLRSVRALKFPAYLYSGCNDRAHAAWLLLPPALRAKVSKIWVAAPPAHSAVVGGAIGLKGPAPGADLVSWNFHIALIYRGPGGERVLDAALSPDATLTRQQWLDRLNLPEQSILLVTHGRPYQFWQVETSSQHSGWVWNGDFYGYNPDQDKKMDPYGSHWIPKALARDAVGAQVMAGKACPHLISLKLLPGSMQSFLETPDSTNAGACAESIALFNERLAHWKGRIPQQSPTE